MGDDCSALDEWNNDLLSRTAFGYSAGYAGKIILVCYVSHIGEGSRYVQVLLWPLRTGPGN